MKLENTKVDCLDLSYEVPQPGVSILQFDEGITKQTNEKSGKTTLRLPLIIHKVVEGPEDNEGRKMSHFVPIETEFGEKQLAGILTLTGLIDGFSAKYKGEVSPLDESFINNLKLKLPGKMVKAHHDLRKDQKGKDQVNISRFEKFSDGTLKDTSTKKTKAQAPEASEDW